MQMRQFPHPSSMVVDSAFLIGILWCLHEVQCTTCLDNVIEHEYERDSWLIYLSLKILETLGRRRWGELILEVRLHWISKKKKKELKTKWAKSQGLGAAGTYLNTDGTCLVGWGRLWKELLCGQVRSPWKFSSRGFQNRGWENELDGIVWDILEKKQRREGALCVTRGNGDGRENRSVRWFAY